ncbi:MAG: YfiR family protein [Burkholderiaceae bacterium]|nr:YfiR family protein [Burkholderiaceae bacterium]
MFVAHRFLQRGGRLVRAGVWLAGWLASTPAAAVNELDVKAAVLANLLAFADWPAAAAPAPKAALVLCVGRQQPLLAPLTTLNGRVVRHWVLQVRELTGAEATASCHALLLDDALLAARPALRRELQSLPLLSFADGHQAMDSPVCIRLDVVEGRVSFTVNLATARANGLTLSSRLLRLAREVKE